ncbi:MAG: helix-turn-helix transcriptional regulator [Propionibacteriales bacterium]|nr:helix-turn-helix transcriptional regulator [Propionibacteriales bacterium]
MPDDADNAFSAADQSKAGRPAELDARRLRGLAHSMRVQILDLLELDGAATATSLAHRLGVKTGTTSWHLLKLAEHGLVEEIPDRGSRRERWWRAVWPGWSMEHADFVDDPELADASDIVLSAVLSQQLMRATQFLHEDWSRPWRQAWILTTDQSLTLDPDAMAAMRTELRAVIERYRDNPSTSDEAERIVLQMHGFPHRTRPQA